ncbi:hypothetical protein M758_9G120400 [Ceratodon purpureus]|nr:hypothetical protein M758_9G120400 [Ceratodon purpureus]
MSFMLLKMIQRFFLKVCLISSHDLAFEGLLIMKVSNCLEDRFDKMLQSEIAQVTVSFFSCMLIGYG